MIRSLWYQQSEAIIDVKLGGPDADSYKCDPIVELLAWLKQSIMIITVIIAAININNFPFFPFCRRHTREGSPGRTHANELNYGSNNGQTHFSPMGMDKRSNYNQGCEIVLMYDPRRSTPQSPAGQGSGLGPIIEHRFGTLNRALA